MAAASSLPSSARPSPYTRAGRDDAAWLMLFLILAVMLPMQLADPFGLSWPGLVGPALAIVVLGAMANHYRTRRPHPNISAMLTGLQLMLLFSACGAALSYMVATWNGPLLDARFAGWDRAMGFDWLAWLHWLNGHPRFADLLGLAYQTLIPQMVALIVILGICRQLAALRTALLAAMMAGFATILLSGIFPAIGTYTYYGLAPADYPNLRPIASSLHMADLHALRDGSLRVLALDHMQGIITFPSYHGALAAVFGWGFSRVTIALVRWCGISVAALTLIATPVDGGHYFSDVIAGLIIASLSILIARKAVHIRIMPETDRQPAPDPARSVKSSPSRHSHAASAR